MTQTNSFGEFPTSGRPEMGLKTVYSAETGDGYEVVMADTRVAPDVPPYTLTDTDNGIAYDFETVLPLMLVNGGVSKPTVDNYVLAGDSTGDSKNTSDDITAGSEVTPSHPSLEQRSGVDPDSDDYWNQLGETRGD